MGKSDVSEMIGKKTETKSKLAKKLGFDAKKALVCVFADEEPNAREIEILKKISEGFSVLDANFVLLADNEIPDVENMIFVEYGIGNREIMLWACDVAICFEANDTEEMLMYGIVPVSVKRKDLTDYDPKHETGNSFLFEEKSAWGVFAAIIRALETFKFPYDWKHIVQNGREEI